MEQCLIIPYEWQGMDFTPRWEDEETGQTQWGSKKYRTFIWGHDQFNEEVCWIIEDFLPHLYVRVEDNIENEDQFAPMILTALNDNLKQYVKEQSAKKSYLKGLLRMDRIIVGYIPDERRPMFYWNTKKHRVYKVFFSLEVCMTLCYEYLDHHKITLANGLKINAKAYNNGQSDRIPIVEKLMVERGVERCSWMFASAQLKDGEGLTTLAKEYYVSYQQLQLLPAQYAKVLGFPKPKTISFDGEMFSAVFTRFPKASRLTDEVYAFGFRYRSYSSLTCKTPMVTNYIFIIWDSAKYGPLKDYSKEYGPSVYIYCRNEEELLMQLFVVLVRLDPTFLISYNGLGFDWDYIEQRCDIFGIKPPNLSRLRSWGKTQFNRKSWKRFSSTWPQYPSRIDVDMLYLIRLQFKYNSYKLKDVGHALLGHSKVELPYKTQFRFYATKDIDGMNQILDYLHTDILLPEELYDKLAMPIYLHTNASVMRVNPLQLYTEGQSIRCICQLYHDVVMEGMYIDSREIWKAGKYIGGLVFDQIPGIYKNVITFDFNSLYPSRIQADNICYTTLIHEEEEAKKPEAERIKDEDCHICEGKVPIVDKKTKEVVSEDFYRFRYIKKTRFVGLLPKIVIRLNKLRSEYKKHMEEAYGKAKAFKAELEALKKTQTDNETAEATEITKAAKKAKIVELMELIKHWQSEGDIWNVKQMAVKVSANSMYGFMGMKTGKFSFIEGGMSTTLMARGSIRMALDIIVTDFGALLIYGDSVTGRTPLLLRLNQMFVIILTIEELFSKYGELLKGHADKEYKIIDYEQGLWEVWTEKGWTKIQNVMRHKTTKKIFGVSTSTGYVEVTEDHSLLNERSEEVTPKEVKLGDKLLHSYPTFNKESVDLDEETSFDFGTQFDAASYLIILKLQGFNVIVEKKNDRFRLTATKNSQRLEANIVKKIELLDKETEEIYVYDLTTDNHHFQAGIGDIIVHNTDSLFVKFPDGMITPENYKTKTKEISKHISDKFPDEVNIVFENFFPEFFTVTKKRYAGIKIDPDHPAILASEEEIFAKKLLYMKGLITVRGNSCGIVYENFDPILVKMLRRVPATVLFDYIHYVVLKIMRRDYILEDYIFRQKLGQGYKNASYDMAIFSDRLKQAGRTHKPGEELEFVYVKTAGDCLVGYKMQAPDLFLELENVLDTMYYITNKIAKPIEQLLTCIYDDTILKSYEKKIIRPRKPTSVQKVTAHWHLEMYIRSYIAKIHQDWEMVQNSIKCLRLIAERDGRIGYVLDDNTTIMAMKMRYGKDWLPKSDEEQCKIVMKKEPFHKHKIWDFKSEER